MDYNLYIRSISADLERRRRSDWDNDEGIIDVLTLYYELIYEQIHLRLVPIGTKNSEAQIRDIIQKYVIGYTDKKKRITYMGALDLVKSKLAKIGGEISRTRRVNKDEVEKIKHKIKLKERYEDLLDKFMSIAAFRSFKYYCLYMQSCFDFTLWEDTMNVFEGFFFYAGRMILDGEVKFLEKQCPTGYGKSISDCFMISFIFGIDIDNDVLKVCGNDKFTDDCFQNIVEKLMLSEKYAKVFPYFAQFNCQKDLMFVFCARKDLKFCITGSKKSTNLRIITKRSDTNGVRAKYLFLDDITQRSDMSNMNAHSADIHAFTHEWFERNYNRNIFYVVASGTTYSQFDLLSHLKRVMGGDDCKISSVNKYTFISHSDYIVPNGMSVFVTIPLLDPDTDESTYPKKISTISARKKRSENPVEFWAMDMQQPMPPDNSPFYFSKLREYEVLPRKGECGRMDNCIAALDPKRRGKDFLSMPIFAEAKDPEHEGQTVYFLVDWLYDDRPMKECIPLVVAKIIQHQITRLYAERNTDECIAKLILDELQKQGYTSCVIDEVYSTEPKDKRIMMAEGDIRSRIIFPKNGMYSPSSDVGKALLCLYGYTYNKAVLHDDAPDSIALFVKRFIMNGGRRLGTVGSFSRK